VLHERGDLRFFGGSQVPAENVRMMPVHNYTPRSQDFFAQRPAQRVLDVNRWLKDYCAKNRVVYLDYFSAMVDGTGLLRKEVADDGLHPNDAGYKIMAPLAEAAIATATAGR
jgi:lysophospholipase L1-like esterase